MKLSFGSDPEFMVFDKNGSIKSAIGIVKGTKAKRIDLGNGHKLFYDNVLCEMNVSPGTDESEVIGLFADCFKRAATAIYPYRLRPQASCIYPPRECEHEDAKVFGCEPEFCAYEMQQLNPPTCEPGNTFRSAGGHIHLGCDTEVWPLKAPIENVGTDDEDCSKRDWGRLWVVRMMDLFVGVPSLFIDHDSTSKARRQLYGKAGTHRPKDYGVEYRATSNFWLQSPKLTSLVYRLACFVVSFVGEQGHMQLWEDESTCKAYKIEDLREAIDNSNDAIARKLMEEIVKKYLPSKLYSEIFAMSQPKQYDFYKEWNL